MDIEAKEKLEQELRFLKESFDAEVISKEEYEKGKERIEKKLAGNGNGEAQIPEKKEEEEKTESKAQAEPEKAPEAKKIEEVQEQKAEIKEQKKDNKAFKYAVVFVVLTLVVFFGYSLLKQNKGVTGKETKQIEVAEKKTNVIVLNDRKSCFNCGTERVLGILENWFGSLSASEIDYNSVQGKELAEKFGVNALPTYILEADIANKPIYSQIKQTFIARNGSYLLSDNAAASSFYFRKENIPNKLDFFAKEDASSIKAEKNLKEFLQAFPNVKFEKHSSASELAKELGIKTFPVFLINNRVKFTGILPAETIKDNFCIMNNLKECDKELSSNLI